MNDSNKTLHSMEMTHTWVEIFKFQPPGGVAEYHVTIRVTDSRLTFVEQAEAVQTAFYALLDDRLKGRCPSLRVTSSAMPPTRPTCCWG